MGWLDALERRAREAVGSVPAAKPVKQLEPVAPATGPRGAVQSFWVTVRSPDPDIPGDGGAVEAVFYFVEGREVVLCDEHGKPSSQRMKFGEGKERQIAAVLWRARWSLQSGNGDFNRPLRYRTPQAIV